MVAAVVASTAMVVSMAAAVASMAVVASLVAVGSITEFPSAAVAVVDSITAFRLAAGTSAKVGTAATTMVGGIVTIGG